MAYSRGTYPDRQQRVAQTSQNVDQVDETPLVLQGRDQRNPGQDTFDTVRPAHYLIRIQRFAALIAQNFDQVHGTPRPLVGKDALPPGQSTARTELPPRAPLRSRDYTFSDPSEYWLFGTDRMATGQSTLDTRRPAAFLAKAYRYPVYDANTGNAFLPEQVTAFPEFGQLTDLPPRTPLRASDYSFAPPVSLCCTTVVQQILPGLQVTDTLPPAFLARHLRYPIYDANSGNAFLPEQGVSFPEFTQATDLPLRAPVRAVDLLTYVDASENWLFGTDAMAVGEQSLALPPRSAARAADYSWSQELLPVLAGQDAVNVGEQSFDLPPHAAARAADYSWSQDLIPNLIGQDAMASGAQRTELPPSPAPLRLRDYSLAESFPLTLIGQDARNTGAQSFDLPPSAPLRARDYTFAPPVNLPALTTVVQQIPYGAQVTDSLPARAAARARDYSWSQELIPVLIGQDATNAGRQSFDLAPSPAPLRARDYSITEAFPLELVSQDAMLAGEQSTALPPIAALRARDYSFVPPVNLACLTTVVQPIPYGQQSTDALPPRMAARARDYSLVVAFPLTLIGQDSMATGEQSTALPPYAAPRAATLYEPGINLALLITGDVLPPGVQFDDLPPKAQARARDYSFLDSFKRLLAGQDAMATGDSTYASELPPKAAARSRDYTWLQTLPLHIYQQLPAGQSTRGTEGPPRGPLRARDYTHLDLTKRNLIGQDAMLVGDTTYASELPPKAYARAQNLIVPDTHNMIVLYVTPRRNPDWDMSDPQSPWTAGTPGSPWTAGSLGSRWSIGPAKE